MGEGVGTEPARRMSASVDVGSLNPTRQVDSKLSRPLNDGPQQICCTIARTPVQNALQRFQPFGRFVRVGIRQLGEIVWRHVFQIRVLKGWLLESVEFRFRGRERLVKVYGNMPSLIC